MALLWEALRQVAFLLDKVAYGFIPAVYELIFYLANVNLANQDIFVAIIERIYLLLGIFMLFRVSFSILQYIVDPGSFSDKSKGFGKLVTNTLVVIILLAATPWIFSTAYDLQNKIIMSNVIPRLILGDTSYVDNSGMTADSINKDAIKDQQASVHSMAVDLQFAIYGAFFTLNVDPGNKAGYEDTLCDPKKLEKDGTPHPNANAFGSKDMVDSGCLGEIEEDLSKELTSHGAKLSGLYKYYDADDEDSNSEGIVDHRDFNTFGSLLWWRKNGGDGLSDFTINYMPIVSAFVGIYLLFLLIAFAIDIAVRVFKLMFLQAVAPIAIVSYIDPKESASNGRLHNWGMECLRTYFSLFLRLAIIYLAIFLVKLLISVFIDTALEGQSTMYYNGIAPEGNLNIFVFIMLVLGIFTFAKKVPQMIEGIFGIKMSGELSLNPFKSGTFTGALAGGALGSFAGFGAGIRAFRDTGDARALVAGITSGAHFGVKNAGKDAVFGGAMANAYKDVTGNELARMNLSRSIMRVGARGKINRLKDLNATNTDEVARLTGEASDAARRRGSAFDRLSAAERETGLHISNMTEEDREQQLMSAKNAAQQAVAAASAPVQQAQAQLTASRANVEQAQSAAAKAQVDLENARTRLAAANNSQTRKHANQRLSTAQAAYDNAQQKLEQQQTELAQNESAYEQALQTYQQAQARVQSIGNLSASYDSYVDAVNLEATAKQNLAAAEKRKKALDTEVSEIVRRTQIDETPYRKTTVPAIDETKRIRDRNQR